MPKSKQHTRERGASLTVDGQRKSGVLLWGDEVRGACCEFLACLRVLERGRSCAVCRDCAGARDFIRGCEPGGGAVGEASES